jgi:hypothetical protein
MRRHLPADQDGGFVAGLLSPCGAARGSRCRTFFPAAKMLPCFNYRLVCFSLFGFAQSVGARAGCIMAFKHSSSAPIQLDAPSRYY